jgi:hypothetical protein
MKLHYTDLTIIFVLQILENDSNIKREEEDQDKITLDSRQHITKNSKDKGGCCGS